MAADGLVVGVEFVTVGWWWDEFVVRFFSEGLVVVVGLVVGSMVRRRFTNTLPHHYRGPLPLT